MDGATTILNEAKTFGVSDYSSGFKSHLLHTNRLNVGQASKGQIFFFFLSGLLSLKVGYAGFSLEIKCQLL